MPRKTFPLEEFPAIDLDSTYIEGKRYYRTPTGNLYPSVTTCLSATKDQSFLVEWRQRVGEKEAERVSRRATTRGTGMHQICEDYVRGLDDYIGKAMPVAVELFHNIKPVIDENVEIVYGNEIALFSDTLKTAGRTDLFCRFQGLYTIADYKTSSKEKKKDWIEDYFIQSTAYAIMIEEMYKHITPIHIPQIAIIIALEEGESKHQLFVEKTSNWRDKVRARFAQYHEMYNLPNPLDYPPPTVIAD